MKTIHQFQLLIPCFIFGGVLAACHGNQAKKGDKGNVYDAQIAFVDSVHDFGIFPADSARHAYTFRFTNTGSTPAVLVDVVPSCRCIAVDYTRELIKAGDEGGVTVIFDGTQSSPGFFDKTVHVRCNSLRTYTLRVRGKME